MREEVKPQAGGRVAATSTHPAGHPRLPTGPSLEFALPLSEFSLLPSPSSLGAGSFMNNCHYTEIKEDEKFRKPLF